MRREDFIEETSQSEDELIFYCDCNNNVKDKVSNIDLWQLIGSPSSWQPLYVADPADNSKYCIKKRSGAYRVPVIIGDYRGETKYNYVIAKSQAYSDESTKKFLASPTGNHKVSFYWYCGMTTAGGCIFDYSGLGNNNANQNNSGIALIGIGSNVLFRAKNNSSASLDTPVGSRSTLKNKWYYVEMSFYYVSPTQYSVSFLLKDKSTNTILASGSHTLTQPLVNTKAERGFFLFLSDNLGSGNWAPNTVDYIKEVKVWKIT